MTMLAIGQKFNRLTYLGPGEATRREGKYVRRLARFRCDCGNTVNARPDSVAVSRTKSCGCLVADTTRERSTKHGYSRTPEYTAWQSMMTRCYKKGASGFEYYGGRGIVVSERWHDFLTFLADMGERPDGTSIDRINNDGNYEPGNCRWATSVQQLRNTRRNHNVTAFGKTQCVAAWAEELGVQQRLILRRLNRFGWSAERTLSTPPRPAPRRPSTPIEPKGKRDEG